jgi:hypothetical protein
MTDDPPAAPPAGHPVRRLMSWRPGFDVVAGGIMFALVFFGAAASGASRTGSPVYWAIVTVIFCLICLGLDWAHEPPGSAWWRAALKTVLHWLGVLLAVMLVDQLVPDGLLTNVNIGLFMSVILALGTFTSGVHTNWRLVVIGLTLGLGTAMTTWLDRYVWLLFLLALAALAVIALVARFRRND